MTKRIAREKTNIAEYLNQIKTITSHDDWWTLFVSLIRPIMGKQFDILSINEEAIYGYKYTRLGNLVFNYSRNFHWSLKIVNKSLISRIIASTNNNPKVILFYIATDGMRFHVYQLTNLNTIDESTMQIVYGFNLSSPMITKRKALDNITHVLSYLKQW